MNPMDPAVQALQAAGTFYQIVAQVSFALLGLWFVVLGISKADWSQPERHRERLHIALFFVLPGTLGLIAILAGDSKGVWRVIFILGALVGLAESLPLLFRRRPGSRGAVDWLLHLLAPVAYLLVGLYAIIAPTYGVLAPLQVEGFTIALVFVLGVVHLWRVFAERPTPWHPGRR